MFNDKSELTEECIDRKKIIVLVLACICVLSVVGCTSKVDGGPSQNHTENKISEEKPNQWGIAMEADNVTAKGLTIVCNHSGGENVAELMTGSYYFIQKIRKNRLGEC